MNLDLAVKRRRRRRRMGTGSSVLSVLCEQQ